MPDDTADRASENLDYLGLADDKLQDYPFTDAVDRSLNGLNQTFITSALFGSTMLLNDGYLLLTPTGRRALTDRDASPVFGMIQAGIVRVFRRDAGDWAGMPARYKQSVPPYGGLEDVDIWDRVTAALTALEKLDTWSKLIIRTPAVNLSASFTSLITKRADAPARLLDPGGALTEDNRLRVLEQFQKARDGAPNIGARFQWEVVVRDPTLGVKPQAQLALMRLAIETYHHNQALCLAPSVADRWRVGVTTRHNLLFSDLYEGTRGDGDAESLILQLPVPDLPPPSYLAKSSNWLDLASPAHPVWIGKARYLRAVATFRQRGDKTTAAEAAAEYSKELARHFGSPSTTTKVIGSVFALAPSEMIAFLAAAFREARRLPTDEWIVFDFVRYVALLLPAAMPYLLTWWFQEGSPQLAKHFPEHDAELAARILRLQTVASATVRRDVAQAHVADLPEWSP